MPGVPHPQGSLNELEPSGPARPRDAFPAPTGVATPGRWAAVAAACLLVWLLMRTAFFAGFAGSDDMYYMRYAAQWGRTPVGNWEARLLGNGLTALSMRVFGREEVAAVLPSLMASLAILACVLYWCRRYGTLRQAWWGGLLAAVLPLDVDMATTVSPHTIMAALMVVGTMAFLRAPDSRRARLAGALLLSGGVVAHFAGVYYVAALSIAALFVDRRRYLPAVVTTMAVGALLIVADMGVFHVAFDNALLRLRACMAETHFTKPIMPRTADGAFNPQYVVWPIRNLLFSKALGVALVVVLIAGLWSYRRLTTPHRILLATIAIYWSWMSFGSEVPWAYVPFDRISRFLHPLVFALALLFAPVTLTHRRRWISTGLGGAVLTVCVLNLLGGGSWGQNVHISRELLTYARRNPQIRFVTDYHTLNEMYIVGGLKTVANVVTTEDTRASKLLDRAATRITEADLSERDEILINPLNRARTPDFQEWIEPHLGALRYETSSAYRTICVFVPPLRGYPWSVRKPSARVFGCLAAPPVASS